MTTNGIVQKQVGARTETMNQQDNQNAQTPRHIFVAALARNGRRKRRCQIRAETVRDHPSTG